MNNDELTYKIWRAISPILLYLLINIIVQSIVMIVITAIFFGNDSTGVNEGLSFIDKLDKVSGENSTIILCFSAIFSIPILARWLSKDQKGKTINAEAIKKIDYNSIAITIPLAFFAAVGVSRFILLFPLDNILGSYENTNSDLQKSGLVLLFLASGVLIPIIEEMIFRGLVYNRIKEYSDIVTATYLSAIAFGIYHFNLVQGIYGFIIGLLLAYLYEKYHTLIVPVMFHMFANISTILVNNWKISSFITDHIIIRILVTFAELAAAILLLVALKNNMFAKKKAPKLIETSTKVKENTNN